VSMRQRYIREIDGLRAFAVLTVIFYHLNGSVPFGWIGVDVFFVISGFVVYKSIAGRLGQPHALGAFYVARVKRLLPAYVATLILSLCLMIYVLPPAIMGGQVTVAFSSIFGFSNWSLDTLIADYFSEDTDYIFFTHFWSLSVEEQFYLVIAPLVLLFKPSHAVIVVATGFSLLLWVLIGEGWAYGTHLRIWELGVGVLIAINLGKFSGVAANRSVAVLGLVLLGSACFLDVANVIIAVLGAACIVAHVATRSLPMSLVPDAIVYVGKLSYSLYLIHWPIFVIHRWIFDPTATLTQLSELAITVVLSVLMHHALEKPLRYKKWNLFGLQPEGRSVMIVLAVTCLVVSSASLLSETVSMSLTGDSHVPVGFSQMEATNDWGDEGEICHWRYTELSQPDFIESCLGSENDKPTLFLIGDSHAIQLHFGFEELAISRGFQFRYIHNNGIPQILERGVLPVEIGFALESAKKGDVIALTLFRGKMHSGRSVVPLDYRFHDDPVTDSSTQNLFAALGELVLESKRHQLELVLIDDGPRLRRNVRSQVCEAQRRISGYDTCELSNERSRYDRSPLTTVFKSVASGSSSVHYVDYHDEFCRDACRVRDGDGRLLMIDHNHISRRASISLAGFWEKVLPAPFGEL